MSECAKLSDQEVEVVEEAVLVWEEPTPSEPEEAYWDLAGWFPSLETNRESDLGAALARLSNPRVSFGESRSISRQLRNHIFLRSHRNSI